MVSAGVAKTSKEPDFIVLAILDSVTVTVAVAVWPADTIIYLLSLRIFSL